jgi:hypothetical protein
MTIASYDKDEAKDALVDVPVVDRALAGVFRTIRPRWGAMSPSQKNLGDDRIERSQRATCQVSSRSSILLPNVYIHLFEV